MANPTGQVCSGPVHRSIGGDRRRNYLVHRRSRDRGDPRGLPALTWPAFNPEVIPPAFTMALLCTAVTLLTCLQADATTGGRHQPNRELMAQGVGNVAAGLIGGNPGGASSTTFLNLQVGGRSRVAGVTSAVVVALAFAVPFNQIPLSMLAGIIIVTGYRVIDWEFLRRVRSIPLGYTVVMLATATVAVLIGFTMGDTGRAGPLHSRGRYTVAQA